MSNKNKAKPSCNKVKNPCKFCLQQVTNKNGLQCQGACKKWAHYKCLNYTPGKISDIKAGIIKVTCPCPDCETTQVKEFLTNPPYTCSNNQCPANRTPKCESYECPSNKNKRSVPVVDYPNPCPNPGCTNETVTCPNPPRHQQKRSHPRISPPRPPTPPRSAPGRSPPGSPQCRSPAPKGKACFSDAKKPANPPGCETKKGKKKHPVKKSPSCSLLSSDVSACQNNCASSSSDSNLCNPKNQASMVQALQEMCGTVGKLSVQLKELMCKMMQ